MISPSTANSAIFAFGVGLAGGGLFHAIGAPVPWMLGSLTVTAILAVMGNQRAMPMQVRGVVLPVIGLLAGSTFRPEIVFAIPHWIDAILLVLVFSIGLAALGFTFFTKVCGFDRQTAFFASAPGGLAELSLIAATLGANVRVIILVQSTRVVMVVFMLPFIIQMLVGHEILYAPVSTSNGVEAELRDWLLLAACGVIAYVIGRYIRIPAGVMVFALLLSAIVHGTGLTRASPPSWLVAGVQVVTGSILGARFGIIEWRKMGSIVLAAAFWGAVLISLAVTTSLAGSVLLSRSMESLFLALSPGGMVEMTVITFAVGIDVAFVVTCQVARIILVVVFAPMIYRLLLEGRDKPGNG